MQLPIDELLVFGPIVALALVVAARKLYLSHRYRAVP
jgi:hypothetical protein